MSRDKCDKRLIHGSEITSNKEANFKKVLMIILEQWLYG